MEVPQIVVSDETYQKRLDICRACEFIRILPVVGEQCQKCGCMMKVKAKIAHVKCPIDKWGVDKPKAG